VFGLNAGADWSHIRTPEERNNWWKMRKVWARGGYDEVAPDEILNHFVSRGEKALIYSGIHHAFTKYRQPVYNIEKHKLTRLVKDRAGNIVYAAIGDKSFTICLHYPWYSQYGYSAPEVCPVDGMIDSLMIRVDPTRRRVGFDTKGTPFGKLADHTSYYKYGYKNFTLADFCDGYIYQKPYSEYETVTWVDGMINDKNLDYFKKQLSIPELKVGEYADYDAKSFNAYFIRKLVKKKQFFESLNQ